MILNDVFGEVSARKPVESILIAKQKRQNPQAHTAELMGLAKSQNMLLAIFQILLKLNLGLGYFIHKLVNIFRIAFNIFQLLCFQL